MVREATENLNILIGSCHFNSTNNLSLRWVDAKFESKLRQYDAVFTVFPRSVTGLYHVTFSCADCRRLCKNKDTL